MWKVLVFLGVASALALGAVWLAEQPGDVSVVWRGLTIETSVAVAAAGVVLLAMAGMLLWSALRFLFGLPTAFSFASQARRRARGYEAVSRGMVAVGSGDPQAARRHAADARKLLSDEPLTLLLTAQAAQISGDKPEAESAFKAMLDRSETRVLGLRGLFVEARRRGDQAAARAFADEAVRLSPSLAWANDALLEFHSTAGEWAQARTAVERRAALRLSDKTESRRHRAVLLTAEALEQAGHDEAGALATAQAALKLEPGLAPAAALAGRLLGERGEVRKAARLIEAAWKVQPQPDLARAYVNLRRGDTASDRLEKAEALMKLKPTDPESAFIVAETAIAARDYARARAALQPLVIGAATVRTCLLMAQVEDGELGSAGRGREWLQRSARAQRDSAWVADGLVSESWLPVSPATGRIDAFVWTVPPAAIGFAPEPAAQDAQPAPSLADAPPPAEASSPAEAPPPPLVIEAEPQPAAAPGSTPAPAPPAPDSPKPPEIPAEGVPRAPDDPGPDGPPAKPGRWSFFGRG